MTVLLVHGGRAPADATGNRTGGVPLAPPGFIWPTCAECDHPLRFTAQALLDDDARVLAIFQCGYEAGMCDDWEADAGGNRAYLFDNQGLGPVPSPVGELGATRAVVTDVPGLDYEAAVTAYGARAVLGGIGGRPAWIRSDRTPSCVDCARPMVFAAHLEEGAGMNFGGGLGYAFRCATHARAKFLWQQ